MSLSPLSQVEVKQSLKIILEQCYKLACTVTDSDKEAQTLILQSLETIDVSIYPVLNNDIELIAEAADAAVDIWVYILNAFAKKGFVVSKRFVKDYIAVTEFTKGAGQTCLEKAEPMNKDEVVFLIRMILSESQELCATIVPTFKETMELILETMNYCKFEYERADLISQQVSVGETIWDMFLNVFRKHNVDLHMVFDEVHKANMSKRNPITMEFEKRPEDGKIIKPPGWKPPNIVNVIKANQLLFDKISKIIISNPMNTGQNNWITLVLDRREYSEEQFEKELRDRCDFLSSEEIEKIKSFI